MKLSEKIKGKLDQIENERREIFAEIRKGGGDNSPASVKYKSKLDELYNKQRMLELQMHVERNRELDVGDGCTYYLWSDSYACTVIKKTKKTITIQRDKATLSPDFKPDWIPGGFAAHCTNAEEQEYTYERNPNGEIYVCHWSEKEGRYRTGSDGSIKIGVGRHEYYDYNF